MSKTKKILHISNTDIRYDSRILKELEVLKKLEDCEVTAFGIEDEEEYQYNVKSTLNIRTFKLLSKKLKFLPRPARYFLNLIEAIIILTIPLLKLRPVIIHCHDTLYLPIALIGKFFCKSQLIYDAHELESDKAGQSKILSKYTLYIEKYAWKNIDLLISVSNSIIIWYNDNFGKKESLLILNSPVFDAEKYGQMKNNYLREKFNIPFDKKIFIYLGILNGNGRGVKLYLDVFQRQNIDSHIVFIGYGECVTEIENIAQQHSNIHYHPAVPHNQVVEVSRSADVGLCMLEPASLSDFYCLPNKLFEYAFSGLFVLASDFPDIKQLVEEYSLGMCIPLNSDEICKAVKWIESNGIEKDDKNLYQLSWAHQAELLSDRYNKILTNLK